jgi:hypothetical protein
MWFKKLQVQHGGHHNEDGRDKYPQDTTTNHGRTMPWGTGSCLHDAKRKGETYGYLCVLRMEYNSGHRNRYITSVRRGGEILQFLLDETLGDLNLPRIPQEGENWAQRVKGQAANTTSRAQRQRQNQTRVHRWRHRHCRKTSTVKMKRASKAWGSYQVIGKGAGCSREPQKIPTVKTASEKRGKIANVD